MSTRFLHSLDGTWQFWPDPRREFSPGRLPEAGGVELAVPAAWQSLPALREYTGQGWYQTHFELSGDWLANRVVVLHFGAVDDEAEVWVNGRRVGQHMGGYLPFELDISAACQAGENLLVVRVDDPLDRFAEIPHGKQSWYGMLSGIWQPVWLESRAPLHLTALRVTPAGEEVQIEAGASQNLPAGWELRVEVYDPHGAPTGQMAAQGLNLTARVPQPLLWDIGQPNLYRLKAILMNPDGAVVDELETRFGFRTIETRAGQILLNGRPIYLRAALDQDYYPDGFCTPPSTEFLKDTFAKTLAMGLNCLRVHIKVADPRYYDAADEAGVLIWTELPNWIHLTEQSRARASETLRGMVARDWNHPAIIIWTIINESWGVNLTLSEQRAWLADTYAELKALDPTRLIVGNSACWGNFHVATDLEDFHNYYAMPDHAEHWRSWVDNFSGRPWWTFAHTYRDYNTWKTFARDPWSCAPLSPAAEIVRQGEEPLLVSEFGNWGLPDPAALCAGYGGEPWWFETGDSWGDGVVYPHGVERRFNQYFLRRAFGDLQGLVHASQRSQFEALKWEIEQMRRQPAIQGYVITELTDVHWESNGLLDMLRQPKSHFDLLAGINADDVIVAEPERRVYRPGELARLEVWLSHYSQQGAQNSWLEWSVAGEHGRLGPVSLDLADVRRLDEIAFSIPDVAAPTLLRVELRWFAGGETLASSIVDLLALPRRTVRVNGPVYASQRLAADLESLGVSAESKLAGARLALVDVITDEIREYMAGGGQVLWLAEDASAKQTHLPGLFVTDRQDTPWQGDWASSLNWINQDRLLSDLPLGGLVDFSFMGLTPEAILQGFAPREFAREVLAGLFVGWIQKPVATIAERRFGRGRLMVCTFRLAGQAGSNPLAARLLQDLLSELE